MFAPSNNLFKINMVSKDQGIRELECGTWIDKYDCRTGRKWKYTNGMYSVLLDFLLTVKAATLIFISGCGSAISSAKEGKSGFIYNLVKSKYAF